MTLRISHHLTNQRINERGFSLIEVTIAMAIAALGIITILGLIPRGMDTMREAGDQAIRGRIEQAILNELQMTPFEDAMGSSPLDGYDGMEFYYDAQGEELSDSKSQGSVPEDRKKGSMAHVFSARVWIPKTSGGKAPEAVGGAQFRGFKLDSASDANPFIRPVLVEVAAVGGRESFDWDKETNFNLITTYQAFVSKLGQDYSN